MQNFRLVSIRKGSWFGLKYVFWLPGSKTEMVRLSVKNTRFQQTNTKMAFQDRQYWFVFEQSPLVRWNKSKILPSENIPALHAFFFSPFFFRCCPSSPCLMRSHLQCLVARDTVNHLHSVSPVVTLKSSSLGGHIDSQISIQPNPMELCPIAGVSR